MSNAERLFSGVEFSNVRGSFRCQTVAEGSGRYDRNWSLVPDLLAPKMETVDCSARSVLDCPLSCLRRWPVTLSAGRLVSAAAVHRPSMLGEGNRPAAAALLALAPLASQ